MRIVKALVVAAILMVMAPLVVSPAFAWLWPILGFHYSCQGYPLQGYKPLPGTPQWPFYPDSGRAELVPPGVAYCPICGNLDFGLTPPFWYHYGFPVGNITNETSGQKAIATNKSSTQNQP
jgi:hypothetical protein